MIIVIMIRFECILQMALRPFHKQKVNIDDLVKVNTAFIHTSNLLPHVFPLIIHRTLSQNPSYLVFTYIIFKLPSKDTPSLM